MGGTRFRFVAGRGAGLDARPRWPDELGKWTGSIGNDGGWVAWRLLGPNNRELGRSVSVFPDLAEARRAADSVRRDIGLMRATITSGSTRGGWTWRLWLDDETAAVCSPRSYLRQQECAYNLEVFLAGVAQSTLTDTDRVTRRPVEIPMPTLAPELVGPLLGELGG